MRRFYFSFFLGGAIRHKHLHMCFLQAYPAIRFVVQPLPNGPGCDARLATDIIRQAGKSFPRNQGDGAKVSRLGQPPAQLERRASAARQRVSCSFGRG